MIRSYQNRDYKVLRRMLEERGFQVVGDEFINDIVYVIEVRSKVIGFISLSMTVDYPLLRHFCVSKKVSRSVRTKAMWQLFKLVSECMRDLNHSLMYIAILSADDVTNKIAKRYYSPVFLCERKGLNGHTNIYLTEVI